ncbi:MULTISPECIES: hypothetical protein [unclassified Bradyrhizobium]|uniref:hypothetical protein n=1 Tax=unclassified Bradyrhizobium TaxID=2631580 RepID=UPI001FF54BCA|nr:MULTISPECIES: hypothetical protein [unclassified Bradyrhizobium]MCJ9699927.1 hypothetical protein [Bradyrhizobium sp. SHOUNA76]MCJ9729834.1 hypothetical protein [Bradyrhizobium sp. PRIMUS42]
MNGLLKCGERLLNLLGIEVLVRGSHRLECFDLSLRPKEPTNSKDGDQRQYDPRERLSASNDRV